MHLSPHFKTISQILILAMLHLCWLTSYGYAEMIPTESANQSQVETDRQRILDLLDRQEVIDELEKYGINKVEATARINSLTDEEVTEIAGRLDELPEGGFLGPSCVRRGDGSVVSGCDSADAGEVLAIIGIIVLVVLFIYWFFFRNKAEVGGDKKWCQDPHTKEYALCEIDSPSSDEGPASEPVIEEVCDPGMESCV